MGQRIPWVTIDSGFSWGYGRGVQFGRAPLNAGPPLLPGYQCQATVDPGISGIDPSTISSAVFAVVYPNGKTSTWSAVLGTDLDANVTITRVYQAGDLPVLGKVKATPLATYPTGVAELETIEITVERWF